MMTAKQLLPNQCDLLHPFYGQDDCCLCKANQRIKELEQTLVTSKTETYDWDCLTTREAEEAIREDERRKIIDYLDVYVKQVVDSHKTHYDRRYNH